MKSFELLLNSVKEFPALERPNIRIAGDGPAAPKVRRLMMEAVEAGEVEANVTGAFTSKEFGEIIQSVDVMYAMYSPLRGNILQGAIPVKMFDAAAHGVPSVVNDGCLMGELATLERMGKSATWGNLASVKNALMEAKSMKVELSHSGEREQVRWMAAMEPVLTQL